MDAIQNVYDGPKKPEKKLKIEQLTLDFIYSENVKEIDNGIQEAIKGLKVSIMAVGISLYRIDVGGMYVDLGYHKFGEYIDSLVEKTGMSRASLYNWEYIGGAYVTYRPELDKIGFSDDDGPTKLPYLARALEKYNKKEVFKAIKEMSKREFEAWSKGEIVKTERKYKPVKIKGNGVFVGAIPLVMFAEDITPEDKEYYENLLLAAAEAKESNEYLKGYRFYDADEARKFDRIYTRELKALRRGKK